MRACTRKVLLQCPQETLAPAGCGSGLAGPGWTGPKFMILLLAKTSRQTHFIFHIHNPDCDKMMLISVKDFICFKCNCLLLFSLSYQYGRGQAIRWDVTLQMRRQLQGHRTYFFPAGAFFIGWREWRLMKKQKGGERQNSFGYPKNESLCGYLLHEVILIKFILLYVILNHSMYIHYCLQLNTVLVNKRLPPNFWMVVYEYLLTKAHKPSSYPITFI